MSEAMVWRPSRELVGMLLAVVGLVVGLVGVMAFVLSFDAVNQASMPFFGPLAFMIPLLGDLTIAVMTAYRLLAELYGLSAPLAKWSARVLIALTVYLNAGHAAGLFGHVIHAAPPIVWALIVEVGQTTIRQLVGLDAPSRIERLRASLWLLRPVPTFVTWRRMRVQQIPTYREAIDLEAATLAVRGRLRVVHGRRWRGQAPLAERLSLRLLRRGQRDASGIADVLREHQATADLLGGAQPPVPAPVSETTPEKPIEQQQDRPAKPRSRTGRKPARKTAPVRPTEHELIEAASTLNATALEATGEPVSLRKLKTELHIGHPTAVKLRDTIIMTAPGAVLEHANGSTV